MSENFEKLVLEKLEKLEAGQQVTNEKLDGFEGKFNSFEVRLDNFEGKLDNFEGRLDKIENTQSDFNKQLKELIFEMKETQEVVKYNTSRIISLENTFKDKVGALFDFRSINDDKHKEFENSMNNLDSKVFDHGIRISALENKINPNNKVAED